MKSTIVSNLKIRNVAELASYPLGEFRDAMWSGHSPMGCAPRHSLQGD
jgi:hypothetical protein